MLHQVAWICRQNRQEWNFAWQELASRPGLACTQLPTIQAAREAGSFELAVVAISRPDEYAWAEINALSTLRPNTRVVCVLGAWCSGLRRVAPQLAPLANYYVHELRPGHVFETAGDGPRRCEPSMLESERCGSDSGHLCANGQL